MKPGFFKRWARVIELQRKHYGMFRWPEFPDLRECWGAIEEAIITALAAIVMLALLILWPVWTPIWALVIRPFVKTAIAAARYDMDRINEVGENLDRKDDIP